MSSNTNKVEILETDPVGSAVASFREAARQLNGALPERQIPINGILSAVLAGEHALLLGPPGTAKSMLTKMVTGIIGGQYFETLLTKFSTSEEVFGPISLQGLQNDEYRRVTKGYLPEADVVFLDEIFKCNSALLNSLLTVLNERQFDNAGQRVDIPLQIAIGASNELPQDESLGALYDRFVFRAWVDYIKDQDKLKCLLLGGGAKEITAQITPDQIEILREQMKSVDIAPVLDAIMEIKDDLSKEGIIVSDRRWVKVLGFVKAQTVLDGRLESNSEDLFVLADCLWNKPEDRDSIYSVIANKASPDLRAALILKDSAYEAYAAVDFSNLDIAKMSQSNKMLKSIVRELDELEDSEKILDIKKEVMGFKDQLAKAISNALGIDLGGV